MWNYKHSEVLSLLLSSFKEHKIRYFILRNYEGLPYKNLSKDVDIIVDPNQIDKAENILKSIYKDNGFINYYKIQFRYGHRCCYGIDIEASLSIHIDLMDGCQTKGVEIFSFEELYSQVVVFKDMYVLNELYVVLVLFIYKLLGQRKPQLKEEYRENIYTVFKSQPEFITILGNLLGVKLKKELIGLIEIKDFEGILMISPRISSSLRNYIFRKNPVGTSVKSINFLKDKFKRVIFGYQKHVKSICLIAPDGTGKTTLIEGLISNLKNIYVSDVDRFNVCHHRPGLLPNLGAVGEKAGVMKEDTDFTNPHRAKPAGFISSFIRMTYYWLDYVIGVPIKLRKDVQHDRFTIYDRYIYDFLVDPYRSRINLPYWLRKLFTKLVIQPRIVFVLLADAETIYKRKQELTIDEINRQLSEFKKLAETNKRFVIIDASKKPEEMVEDAVKIVIDKFTEKL